MSTHIEDFISAYLDNELEDSDRNKVEVHLENCVQCRALLIDIMEIKNDVFSAFLSYEVPNGLEDQVMNAINLHTTTPATKQRYWLMLPLLSGLCFFIIAFVFFGPFIIKLASIMFKVMFNLVYAAGSIIASEPYLVVGAISFSILLILASSISLKHFIKTNAI